MSQTVRGQLIEILNTLQSANDLLETLFRGAVDEGVVGLLTDCQSCAITMGNKIEAVYGSGLKCIHALEDYCESIYQLSQKLDEPKEGMSFYRQSQQQLADAGKYLAEEIPDKREVVFMPYKASMWDSLESVYLAAKEDPNCEAYVVPIPYFDRKSDKTLGEMHYEGGEYPSDIPIVNWEQYSFEERQPDVIYIHNAYDDSNLVTCVHPRFFSSNLKKYTEKLIYIPYFVLDEIDPTDQVKIDAMKHFCFLPGIVNADEVILQSENMRQIYIKEYSKVIEAAGGNVDRKQLEKKFLGTGSPKFDKVINTKKEDLDIPEEWLRIIKKPDGSWKKIVFYNTTVTALLQYNEKMLEKMKYVFSVFKKHRDNVALLWRPHPLIQTTIESMRPQLWKAYHELVEQYREEGWGIYDDSSDIDRAVVLCDAYYGDQSSVVQLVEKTGKKVILEKVLTPNIQDEIILDSTDAVVEKNKIWILSDYVNVLLEIDISSGVIYNTYPMPDLNKEMYASCSFVKKNQKLYFAPYNANEMWRFDLERRKYEKLEIGLTTLEKNIQKKFRLCISLENKLLLVGDQIKELFLIDIDKWKVTRYSTVESELECRRKNNKDSFFGESYIVNEGIVYLPIFTSNSVLEFDMKKGRYKIYDIVDQNSDGYCSIDYSKGAFYLLNWKDDQIVWNLENGVLDRKRLNVLTYVNGGYRDRKHFHEKTVLFAGFENKIYVFDEEFNTVKTIVLKNTSPFSEGAYYMFRFIVQINNFIYFQTRIDGKIYLLNMLTNESIEEVKINISERIVKNMISDYFHNNKRKTVENEIVSIDDYLCSIEKLKKYGN